MHPLYYISVTGRVTNPRHQALHAGIEHQHRQFGTVFLYPDDRVVETDHGIEVCNRYIKVVSREVFVRPHLHADNELPLISGSQFGVFNGFAFDGPLVVGVIGKSRLSGVVSGLSIAVVQKDKGCVSSHGSGADPRPIRSRLIAAGSRAYAIHR